MLPLYVASLIFGGILITFSLFFGGEHTTDTDADVHTDLDFDTDDIPHDVAASDLDAHSGSAVTEVFQFFSLRNITYFTAFFGLTGTIFSLLNFASIITLLSSLGIGGFAWVFSYRLIKYLKSSASGETFDVIELRGKKGKISLEASKMRKGKVIVDFKGSNYEIPAIVSENSEIEKLKFREDVLVIDIQNGIAVIEKYDL
jgi:hypothetical protein